jgi:dTDP-4-amino-4,6-dideoxygalactose transaminase
MGFVGLCIYNENKSMTTGGGGMIVSNSEELLGRAKHLTTQAKSDELYYTHDEIGYNYRMTNLQAALGLAQLEQLESFIQVKKDNYNLYKKEIQEIPGLRILDYKDSIRPNYWFYALYIEADYRLNRDQLIQYLAAKKIQARPIWGLISNQKPYEESQTYKLEVACHYVEKVVNIPCSSNLTREEVAYVIECLKEPEVV